MLCKAELKFFNSKSVDPPCIPSSIEEVLKVTAELKADGATAPASVLMPYLTIRKRSREKKRN